MKKFAIVFPGQGSQTVGMLSDLVTEFPVVLDTFKKASDVLGYDLWKLIQEGPIEELNKTWKTQPALLTASVAVFEVFKQKYPHLKPELMAGHSLGEYSALVCSGVIDFQDAIKLVELRGKLMQQAVPEGVGAMYAIIGLDNESIIQACTEAAQGEVVSAVNFNSLGQVVIAGNKAAVERAAVLCKTLGAKRALPLPVSVPSHCSLMKPAADQLAISLESIAIKSPVIPVINNVDVKKEDGINEIRDALVRQLYSPVRWTETVEKMYQAGIEVLVEVGPGKVLSGLTKRINTNLNSASVNDIKSLVMLGDILS
ncbi:[acyl-carrier-protein] S-malonyltransferase [Bisgaardia hudsonensis]|uniref:Malonyl CoA-acyl carrier protein transacylase n=1 Tax=Bisgaardia hudsonensis TaxID=109472 RepID=A0A4R2MXG6_9PAST|nr:ACP S-malonyltransferase [Bisgaardia hudsonensis]QLB13566.1 malonyl CoA-acyl carrier protein transacylase [Bisgaardia hudsonensis]TCP11896.1 [acyl-carrier-protein] S-malonyltransferase [Bisgaardia hudsonensis]